MDERRKIQAVFDSLCGPCPPERSFHEPDWRRFPPKESTRGAAQLRAPLGTWQSCAHLGGKLRRICPSVGRERDPSIQIELGAKAHGSIRLGQRRMEGGLGSFPREPHRNRIVVQHGWPCRILSGTKRSVQLQLASADRSIALDHPAQESRPAPRIASHRALSKVPAAPPRPELPGARNPRFRLVFLCPTTPSLQASIPGWAVKFDS